MTTTPDSQSTPAQAQGQDDQSQASQVTESPSVVCVPIDLDAFVLSEKLCDAQWKSKIAPLHQPDYSGLSGGANLRSDLLTPIDLHAASPASVNTRVTDVAGTGQVRNDRVGVYLH